MTAKAGRSDALRAQIEAAFGGVEYPGDWNLRGSNEGSEPFEIEGAFQGKCDWRTLTPAFIGQPALSSALSFISDEAFRFYLPAYMIADLGGLLKEVDPVFHLTHGLDDESRAKLVNPRRYGRRTWLDQARFRFAMFSGEEVAAIIAFLEFKRDCGDGSGSGRIEQALENYWRERARELSK